MAESAPDGKSFTPKDHPFVLGCSLTFIVCAAFGGMYLHLNGARIESLKENVSRLEVYEHQYRDGLKAQEQLSLLEARYNELREKHAELVDANWEQSYQAEQIRNTSLLDRLSRDENRHNDEVSKLRSENDSLRSQRNDLELRLNSLPAVEQKALGEGLRAFDGLLSEKKQLLEENAALKRTLELQGGKLVAALNEAAAYQSELANLRTLVRRMPPPAASMNGIAAAVDVDLICAAVEGVTLDTEAARIILQQMRALGKRITGPDFARILVGAGISDDWTEGQVIAEASGFLVYPLSPETTRAILANITADEVQAQVTLALSEAQAKATRGK